MDEHEVPRHGRPAQRPIRVVIESERLSSAPLRPLSVGGVDVTICSGPGCELECCPLVTDGRCPAGDFDVVVSSLRGPWAESIHRAWLEQHIVATQVADEERGVAGEFDAHLGAGLTALFRANFALDEDAS